MSNADSRIRRMRFLAAGLLAAAFLAGGLAGAAYERYRADAAPMPFPPGPMPPGPPLRGEPPNIFAPGGPIAGRLDLSAEQSERIERIIAEDRAKAQATFDEVEPRLRARFDSTRAAIEAVLTPDQRETFDRIQQENREMLRARFGGRRPGPDRPPGPPLPQLDLPQ